MIDEPEVTHNITEMAYKTIAGNTTYTIINPTGEMIYSGSSAAQTFTTTGSVHPASVSIHAAGRIAMEFGSTVRAGGSFNVDDRLTRDNS